MYTMNVVISNIDILHVQIYTMIRSHNRKRQHRNQRFRWNRPPSSTLARDSFHVILIERFLAICSHPYIYSLNVSLPLASSQPNVFFVARFSLF